MKVITALKWSLAALATSVSLSSHAILLTTSDIAPTVDGADIAHQLGAGDGEEKLWTDTRAIGQTFMTGADDVFLNAVTLRIAPNRNGAAEKDYTLTIGSVIGSVYTAIRTESFTQSGDVTAGQYFTMTLDTPLALVANSLFGFDLAMTRSTTDWRTGIPYMATSSIDYADGQQFRSATNALSTPNIGFIRGDKVFHLDLTAQVPTPGTLVMALPFILILLRLRNQQRSK